MLCNKYIEQEEFGYPLDVLKQKTKRLRGYKNILVKVLVRTINPSDILSINGEGQYIYNHPVPRVPGFEAVGEVFGSENPEFAIGDRVLIMSSGTWQMFMDLSPQFLLKLPRHISNKLAVQTYVNGLTSWIILTELINVKVGDHIIMNAGNSSIAKLFIQLSKHLNYKITVVTSSLNYKGIYDLGADFVISSNFSLKNQIKEKNIPTPNIALDAVGGYEGLKLLQTIDNKGMFIVYGCLSMQNYPKAMSYLFKEKQIDPKRFFLKQWENRVSKIFRDAKLCQFWDCLSQWDISLPIYKEFHIENYQEALIEYEKKKGKILLYG